MKNTSDITNSLKSYISEQVAIDAFSGSVLVAKGYKPIFEFSVGFSKKENQTLNSIGTKFNLGSANKMFTAIAIAQLVEKKKISFNDPVGKYLQDYPNQQVRENVTVHNLLTHTSGLGSFIDIKYRNELLAAREQLTSIDSVLNLFKDKPLETTIGEFNYSSNGYELLGAIIEKVSGESYYDYVKEHIYKPSNMANTDSYLIDPQNPPNDLAIGYTNRDPYTDRMVEGNKFNNFGLNLLKGTASGSGYSTCHDLLNFAHALLKNKLLPADLTQLVLSPKINEGSKGNQTKYYGYGFQIFDIGGVKRIGHPGRFSGVNVRFDMYPDLGYIVIVLANYDPPAAFNIAEKVTELLIN